MREGGRFQDASGPQSGLLRALVDGLPAMIAYWDAKLRCRFANRAYEQWFGVDPEKMIGRDMEEFLGTDVTSRKRQEVELRATHQALARQHEVLEHFFTMSPDLMCIAGVDGYFRR